MKKKHINELSEYIKFIDEIQKSGRELWFRGVENREFTKPGIIWRKFSDEEEAKAVHSFLAAYKGFGVPIQKNPWDIYSLMQHHGLPTRLLDWTKSPLVALYFALDINSQSNLSPTVWAISPHQINKTSIGADFIFCPASLESREIVAETNFPINMDSYLPGALDATSCYTLPEYPIAIEASMTNSRVRAQQGCFTVHGSNKSSVIDLLIQSDNKSDIIEITLPTDVSEIKNMKKSLYGIMITEDYIFQDLNSLSKRITREIEENIFRF